MDRTEIIEEATFGLDCWFCEKQIKKIPCKMFMLKDKDWHYAHNGCYEKAINADNSDKGILDNE